MKKEVYPTPEMEVTEFDQRDVIVTSDETCSSETPIG